MRTDQEVLERVNALEAQPGADMFAWRREVLICYGLSFDAAGPFRADHATVESWGIPTDETIRKAAGDYLIFAIDKAKDHRGISASRSLDKLMEFAWLMGLDDTAKKIEHANDIKQYGAPQLRVFALDAGLDQLWANAHTERLERMTNGEPCTEDCMDGCES